MIHRKNTNLFGNVQNKRLIPPQTDGMIRFDSNIDSPELKVIFKWRNINNNKKQRNKRLYKEQTFAPRVFHSVSGSQNSHRTTQTNAVNRQKTRPEPAIRDAQKLAQNVFPPWRPTLTSRSLQSIARPFQKRFREVFANARILIFYLSTKAWEVKSLPKSHLGWLFLVFSEGKATKENISIFWFIWPVTQIGLITNKSVDVCPCDSAGFEHDIVH